MGFFNKENNTDEAVINQAAATNIQEQKCKRLYLVDYENVSDAGLVGVDTLTVSDSVVIFYGSKVKSIAYESLIAITSSKANIEHLKAEKTAKNYLDFQLTTYLGFKLGKDRYDEIVVISKDSGFDAVVDFWTDKGLSISRRNAIVEKPVEESNEEAAKPSSRTNRSNTRRTPTTNQTRKTPTRANVTTKPRTRKPTTNPVNAKDKTRN